MTAERPDAAGTVTIRMASGCKRAPSLNFFPTTRR